MTEHRPCSAAAEMEAAVSQFIQASARSYGLFQPGSFLRPCMRKSLLILFQAICEVRGSPLPRWETRFPCPGRQPIDGPKCSNRRVSCDEGWKR